MRAFKRQPRSLRLAVLLGLTACGWGLAALGLGGISVMGLGLGVGATVAFVAVAIPFETWVRGLGVRTRNGREALSVVKEMTGALLMAGLLVLATRWRPELPLDTGPVVVAVIGMVLVITELGESIPDRTRQVVGDGLE